ncbi:hypothetical protein H8B13_06750 [Hymenobacter sp. BT188]|uniref:hypothetical protein n=1 Tax=Hymenobacter sp. BT188 TaxID=2763504 RepID=UPI0016513FC7|nr:hypothetical protein [Hymenobacter sp. BT188]MBC6606510.1 hypothetical protein [Hymenobacter sp. BT188]
MKNIIVGGLGMMALVIAGQPVLAQEPETSIVPSQPARLELPFTQYDTDVHVLAIPEDSSVVMLVEKDVFIGSRTSYTFHKFDHQLKDLGTRNVEIPIEYEFKLMSAEATAVYALFQSRYAPERLLVAGLDGRTGDVALIKFDTEMTRDVLDQKVLAGNLFVTVLLDQHMTVVKLDMKAGKHQLLPSVYEPLTTELTFLTDSATKRAEVIMRQSNGVKSRLQLKQLSAEGELLNSEFVQTESERSLITAQVSLGDSSDRMLAGTYTLRDPRYSQGIFSADLTAGTTPTGVRQSLRFYDFTRLKHFFDYLKPARAARIRQRSQERRAANRELPLRYRLLVHDLMPFQNGYVLVAEVYYPRYRSDSYGPGMVGTRYRQFDGYHTTHAIVCGFDRRGNLLWDNTFVLKDVESYELEETVRLRPMPDGQRLVMTYLEEENIHYKIIDRSLPTPNDLVVPLQPANPDVKEKLGSTNYEGMQAWYGSRFLAFGYQYVRTPRGGGRDVFFLNTVAFD